MWRSLTRLMPAVVVITALSACDAETFSTVVRVDLLFPVGSNPLDAVESLNVGVASGDETFDDLGDELSRPHDGWDELDVGVALGLVDLEQARIVLEGRDAGGVLVAWGETIPVPLQSGLPGHVALFFQELGSSGAVPPHSRGWSFHAATYLEGGGVLVAGGADERATDEVWVYAVDLYEPIGGLQELDFPRSAVTLMTLDRERGLLLGGSQPTKAAQVYDPVGDSWTDVPFPGGEATSWPWPAAASLADGGVVAVRGRQLLRFSAARPTTVALLGELPTAPLGATLSVLSMQKVMIVSSDAPVQAFHPSTGVLLEVAPSPTGPREGHGAAVLSDGRLVLVGGESESALIGDVEVYDPETDDWTVHLGLLDEGLRRDATATTLRDDRILITGGLDESGAALANALVLDLDEPSVTSIDLISPRWGHSATMLPTGAVLVMGGEDESGEPLDQVEVVRPPLAAD